MESACPLDLTDPLPGQVEFVTDLFQRARVAPVEAEAEAEDFPLPLVEAAKELFDLGAEHCFGDNFEG